MQIKKSINLIIIYLIIAVFFIILCSNYSSGDFFWTPLRSIYIFKTRNLWDYENLKSLINSTIHNDSIKLFPIAFEIIGLKFTNNWEPRISLLLGLISWFLNIYLFFRIVLENFKLNNKYQNILALILLISFSGPPYFFYRFTTVFALIKTIPSLCLIYSTQILFKKDKFINGRQLILLSIFCCIAQFSYSWGSILWITTYCVLFIKNRVLKRKYLNSSKLLIFTFIGTLSTTIYISIFNFSTLYSLYIKNNISTNLKDFSSSLKNFYSFLSTYSMSYLGGLDSYSKSFPRCLFDTDIVNFTDCGVNKLYINFSMIIFSLFLFFLSIQIIKLKKKKLLARFISESAPFIYIAINTSSLVIANIFLRSHYHSPPRYFVESTLFSASLILITLISLNICKFNFFKLFIMILIFLSSFINFLNINIYTFKSLNNDPIGDPQFLNQIKCIRNAPEYKKNYEYLYNNCEFWKTNKYFQKESKFSHPFIKIKNVDSYTKKVFSVLRK